MSSRYVDLVLAQMIEGGAPFFCVGAPWSVSKGDLCILSDYTVGTVLYHKTVDKDSVEYAMAICCEYETETPVANPVKILISGKPHVYEEEEVVSAE